MSADSVAQDMIQAFFERWQRLEEEKVAISGDLKELFAEAKANGFDPKVLRVVFRDKVADQSAKSEFEAVYDLYWSALGTNYANARDARETYGNEWQAPRVASLGDQKDAYRAGRPISQDFRFENANVYFFAFPKLGRVKIGVTNDVEDRLLALEKETGAEGFILHYRPGNRQAEMAMHERFGKWRVEGEWFEDCRELRAALSDLTEPEHDAETGEVKTARELVARGVEAADHGNLVTSGAAVPMARNPGGDDVAPPPAHAPEQPGADHGSVDTPDEGGAHSSKIRRMSMTPLEPREAGGLKGFGFTVRFDEPETIPPVADPATVVSEAGGGDSAPSLAAIPVADRSKPNPICRDPGDCGVYASWAMPCQACKAAAAHRSAA